ncbi:hypothetical protein [Corallococcus macrosporus]|uniref:Uncharacterized protein n=1 Tax=Corallococcus macrosporus DSM 14697 TaxID=1189310 RepID=A0A250K275_9BACT|nr:hypothetical protein [Corallococcus macrosporus]ATB50068.1 hypothetical protein MYMAC_005723 [Corallococcus macrosporus DSM 14697]
MRALLILGLTLAAGPAAAAVPSGCQEDFGTCKEDCSIEFGGSGRTVEKLTHCLADCQENLGLCADRHSSLKGLPSGVVADPPRRRRGKRLTREEDPFGDGGAQPTRRRKSREEDPFGDEQGSNRRDGYRASESSVAVEPSRPAPEPIPPPPSSGVAVEATRTGYRATEPAAPPPPAPADPASLGDLDSPDDAPTPTPPAVTASPEKEDPLVGDDLPEAPPPAAKKPAPSKSSRPALPPEPEYDISDWDPDGD